MDCVWKYIFVSLEGKTLLEDDSLENLLNKVELCDYILLLNIGNPDYALKEFFQNMLEPPTPLFIKFVLQNYDVDTFCNTITFDVYDKHYTKLGVLHAQRQSNSCY